MEPVLYIDILFLVNWMMDAVVLILTGQLLRRRIRLWKVSLAAAAGALWACLCAAFAFSGRLMVFLPLGPAACLMVWIAYPFKTVRELFRGVTGLYLSVFVTGGLLHGIFDNTSFGRFWRLWMADSRAGAVSVWLLALALAGSFLMIECLLLYRKQSQSEEWIRDVTLHYRGRELTVAALWDSGNQLHDPFTGKAVHILELEVCGEWLGNDVCRYLECISKGQSWTGEESLSLPAIRLIPCRSVGASHSLLAVLAADSMVCAGGYREDRPLIGLCLTTLSKDKRYRMLLHSQTDKKRRNPDDY